MINRSLALLAGLSLLGVPRPEASESAIAVPPMLRFTTPATATVVWESSLPGTGALAFGKTPKLGTVVEAKSEGMVHTVRLTGLEPGQSYHYRVGTTIDGQRHLSSAYEFDNALNFSLPAAPNHLPDTALGQARMILEKTGVSQGYCLTLGYGDTAFLLALAQESALVIYALEKDGDKASRLRRALYSQEAYGSRVSVLEVNSYDELPLTTCLANLILVNSPRAGLEKHLVPGRGKLLVNGRLTTRGPLDGIGEWTHQYGDAANTANSGETLSGASSTADMKVQWVGRPGGDFGIDRNPRMPAPVAAGGRLFHQGLNRLAALDAYNGSVLWSLEIPDLRRVNIPRDCSNWCVAGDRLFIAIRDRAWIHDATTGKRMATLPVPARREYPLSWGYIAHAGGRLFGSAVRSEAIYQSYWGGDAWYDAKAGGLGTAKVCSDSVFAYDLNSRQLAWTYEKGVILNPTLSVGQGKVIFIESRHPKILSGEARQINSGELWLDQYLVALDEATGAVIFERPIDVAEGTVSFYLQITDGGILVTASNTEFHLYHFHLETGELMWKKEAPWPDDHHSGPIQHPVVVGGTIYLQPNGYDLQTGEIVTSNVGERSGCHTYVGARDCLIYRGENRQIAMWDRQEERVTSWTRLRPSCWLSVVPSNGMLLVPEGGAGCSCGGWMETSLAFGPRTILGYPALTKGESK